MWEKEYWKEILINNKNPLGENLVDFCHYIKNPMK
jgi:hypothetical protein